MLIINNGTTVRSVKPFLLNTNKHNEEIVAPEKYHSGLVASFNFGSTQAPKNIEGTAINGNMEPTKPIVEVLKPFTCSLKINGRMAGKSYAGNAKAFPANTLQKQV